MRWGTKAFTVYMIFNPFDVIGQFGVYTWKVWSSTTASPRNDAWKHKNTRRIHYLNNIVLITSLEKLARSLIMNIPIDNEK